MHMPKLLIKPWGLLKETFSEWSNDKAPRLGAALSYYTIFSLAPLLVLVISIAGLVFGQKAAEGRLLDQLSQVVGTDAGVALQSMVAKAGQHRGGIIATIISIAVLMVGATGVVIELQDALNTVWKVVPKPGRGIKGLIHKQLLSIGIVLAFGFLFIVSLVAGAARAAGGRGGGGGRPGGGGRGGGRN